MSASARYQGTSVSRGKVVPLISSYVAGPLGLIHLPRLWLKALLHAKDILAEDWGCGPGGLDKRIMGFVGIDGDAFIPWLMSAMPNYDGAEAWVREHAANLTPGAIAESNSFLREHPLPLDLNVQFRAYMQIPDDSLEVGIMLNNYDDWHTLHRYVLRFRDALEPIVPAISPTTTGAMGAPQLPRQWLKDLLAALGALPPGYALTHEPADELVLDLLGVDPLAARAYVARELPTYLAYEKWIAATARKSPDAIVWSATPLSSAAEVDRVHEYDWGLLHSTICNYGGDRARRKGVHAFEITGLLKGGR